MQYLHAQRLCGGSLATPSTEQRTRMREIEIIKRLLARRDRDPWSRAQLERVVGGDPLDLSDALRNLNAAGVVHLSEDNVTVSRAARWTADLMTDL
jgi:predicted transcriptional regulator